MWNHSANILIIEHRSSAKAEQQRTLLRCVPVFYWFKGTLLLDHHPHSLGHCKTYHTIWKRSQTFITVLFLQHFECFCSHQFIFKTKPDRRPLLTMCFHDDRQKERIQKHLLAVRCLIVQYWNFVSLLRRLRSTCSYLSHIDSATHTILIKSVLKLYSHAV